MYKVSPNGFEYQLPMYPKAVQEMIVEHFVSIQNENGFGIRTTSSK